MSIFTNWDKKHTEAFQKDIIRVNHSIADTGLFTDEKLVALLDAHPASHMDVCLRASHDIYEERFRTGDFRKANGHLLLDLAKNGKIWIQLREVMNMHPEYSELLDQMYGELSERTGVKSFKARGGLLITSPIAKTPYHFDPTDTILWHIRGQKTIYFYPTNKEFLPDEGFEHVLFSQNEDYLPYNSEMEKQALAFELQPGEMISWPLNKPHRVENNSFCVSITAEYSTPASSFKNSVIYTNAVMRQKFGMSPSWYGASYPEKLAKAAAGKVLRKMNVLGDLHKTDEVTFKIDPDVPGYIADMQPQLRAF